MNQKIICLMGPTASGKTPLAIAMTEYLPVEIISVDSSMVYKGMNIGTAKPDVEILKQVPHQLIDLRDPANPYSAGEFVQDAQRAINTILAKNKIPLLVGGTMMYFRTLQQGLANLPVANQVLREQIQAEALQKGWPSIHAQLKIVDSLAASRIHPHDQQRIQRALEVYRLTGKRISEWHQNQESSSTHEMINIALMPSNRALLHARIADRFQQMLRAGFIAEVERLYQRNDLTPDLPAIRAVGYRQAWAYLSGELTYEEMCEQTIIATRQLAKRQMTWLRSWPEQIKYFDSFDASLLESIRHHLQSL